MNYKRHFKLVLETFARYGWLFFILQTFIDIRKFIFTNPDYLQAFNSLMMVGLYVAMWVTINKIADRYRFYTYVSLPVKLLGTLATIIVYPATVLIKYQLGFTGKYLFFYEFKSVIVLTVLYFCSLAVILIARYQDRKKYDT